jgi:hypothetical protein
MADREVTKTRRKWNGDVAALCSDAWWSPASASEAIKDIENGKHRYFMKVGESVIDINVISGVARKYLRSDPAETTVNALYDLPVVEPEEGPNRPSLPSAPIPLRGS